MSKKLATLALAAAVAAGSMIPAAQADPGRHYRGHHHAYNGGHHRGRGHWHNGKWIALGIIGAAAAAAAADSEYRDCYYRNGRRYCED